MEKIDFSDKKNIKDLIVLSGRDYLTESKR